MWNILPYWINENLFVFLLNSSVNNVSVLNNLCYLYNQMIFS